MREKIIAIYRTSASYPGNERDKDNCFMQWKLTDNEFEKLWQLNIWEKLGEVCNLDIGRFDDVEFTGENLHKARDFLLKKCLECDVPEIRKLKSFFENGIIRKTGVIFSF
ncbi:hypothetical protein [Sebaldella sp. S0638]|uniref:hypothetical protein n=1 Tax=Sebaldella sp. S0638 TaxID=2957809 RepID=UPI00209F2CE2|nr:hypothetical protein [Sebaldella sp. S0638]MCP1224497.1 hypothetical protein [Sebaldella sp. S0638]